MCWNHEPNGKIAEFLSRLAAQRTGSVLSAHRPCCVPQVWSLGLNGRARRPSDTARATQVLCRQDFSLQRGTLSWGLSRAWRGVQQPPWPLPNRHQYRRAEPSVNGVPPSWLPAAALREAKVSNFECHLTSATEPAGHSSLPLAQHPLPGPSLQLRGPDAPALPWAQSARAVPCLAQARAQVLPSFQASFASLWLE